MAEEFEELPEELMQGTLTIGDAEIKCYVLDDKRRVLSQATMISALDMSYGSPGPGNTGRSSDRLVRFTQGNRLAPYIDEDLRAKVEEPIKFRMKTSVHGREVAYGYEAETLVRLCRAVLEADRDDVLQAQQKHIAQACALLMSAVAVVGIIALVDEATGYQYEREKAALAEVLEAFVAKELAAWVNTFPPEYYREMARLRHLRYDPSSTKRPRLFGKLTAQIVYKRLAPGVLEELQSLNPSDDKGQRRHRHHQWLTRDIGHPKLRDHISKVITIMQLSDTWEQFVAGLDRVVPPLEKTIPFAFMGPQWDSADDDES